MTFKEKIKLNLSKWDYRRILNGKLRSRPRWKTKSMHGGIAAIEKLLDVQPKEPCMHRHDQKNESAPASKPTHLARVSLPKLELRKLTARRFFAAEFCDSFNSAIHSAAIELLQRQFGNKTVVQEHIPASWQTWSQCLIPRSPDFSVGFSIRRSKIAIGLQALQVHQQTYAAIVVRVLWTNYLTNPR